MVDFYGKSRKFNYTIHWSLWLETTCPLSRTLVTKVSWRIRSWNQPRSRESTKQRLMDTPPKTLPGTFVIEIQYQLSHLPTKPQGKFMINHYHLSHLPTVNLKANSLSAITSTNCKLQRKFTNYQLSHLHLPTKPQLNLHLFYFFLLVKPTRKSSRPSSTQPTKKKKVSPWAPSPGEESSSGHKQWGI